MHLSRALLVGAVAAVVILGGCVSPDSEPADGRLRVVVSILPQREFVERVGGARVRVSVLIPPGAEPHAYEPAPSQLIEVSAARLLVVVGSGLPFEELWTEKLRRLSDSLEVVDCSAGVAIAGGDPHIWLSPRRARVMVDNVCRGLVRADPAHRDEYERNRDAYAAELVALDAELSRRLRDLRGRAFMVYHPSWGYFAADYGLRQLAVEEEGKEPTIRGLARLTAGARQERLAAILVAPQFDTRAARAIAREAGVRLVTADPLAPGCADNLRRVAAELASVSALP